jgi:tetratricopeptide (TPR) repeat protein
LTIVIKSFGLLLSAVLIVVLIRPVISEYYVSRPSADPLASALNASNITNEDARYHYLLGLYYQEHGNDYLSEAIEGYKRSLERDSTRALTWLALSTAYSRQGDKRSAEYAIRRAASVDRANPKVIWEAGVFYLTEGQPEKATAQFRHYLYLVPSEQDEVYTLFSAVGAEPKFALSQLLPPEYRFYTGYFKFLMTYKQKDPLAKAWAQRSFWKPENSDYLAYCDFLIDAGRLTEARSVWTELIQRLHPESASKDLSNLVFNGNFEYPILDGGFDWKTGDVDGVKIFIDTDTKKTGRSSLAAQFNGRTNPGVYIAQQAVAVEPKQHYQLCGQIKTENLTTHNGILLEVLGQDCSSPVVRSEVVTGTTDWAPLKLEFTTPANCRLVKIGIKREQSQKFDNKIAGTSWLDDFRMLKVSN